MMIWCSERCEYTILLFSDSSAIESWFRSFILHSERHAFIYGEHLMRLHCIFHTNCTALNADNFYPSVHLVGCVHTFCGEIFCFRLVNKMLIACTRKFDKPFLFLVFFLNYAFKNSHRIIGNIFFVLN